MRCLWCGGTGTNRAEYGPVECPDCDGTGIAKDEETTETDDESEEQDERDQY
jgi:DnaJ-class molecular chaperone